MIILLWIPLNSGSVYFPFTFVENQTSFWPFHPAILIFFIGDKDGITSDLRTAHFSLS